MSRIYVVYVKGGATVRWVRANSLNGAIRAVAAEKFTAKAASTEEVYQAMSQGAEVLDAVAPEQVDIDDEADPGPVPMRAA